MNRKLSIHFLHACFTDISSDDYNHENIMVIQDTEYP